MPKAVYEQLQFQGIHTQPAKGGNPAYARDMQNLRINGNGWLQLRPGTQTLGDTGNNISGIAATTTHVFYLRASELYVRQIDDLTTETQITGTRFLAGRLSIIDYNTYVILTSEGTDTGYILDMRDSDDITAYPLGLPAPGESALIAQASDTETGQLENFAVYEYKISTVALGDDDENIIWYGMESEASPTSYNRPSDNAVVQLVNQSAVQLTFSVLQNAPATHVNIYRSQAIEAIDHTNEDYTSIFRKVATVAFPATTWIDRASEETYQNGELLETGNQGLPSNTKTIYRYNDLVFAPNENELRYSDVRNGTPIPWAFPLVNNIRPEEGGRIDFCAEINETLLFGSRDGLWRLTGGSEYDFAIGQISRTGPVDGYAWSKVTNALAFVGEGGLFLTDASTVTNISENILDRFFRNQNITRGAITFLKDNDILFSLTLRDSNSTETHHQFKLEDAYWTRWNLLFRQAASIIKDNQTLVLIADGGDSLKQLDWNNTTNSEAFVGWHWESHPIDAQTNKLKRFSKIEFTGSAELPMTLSWWTEDNTDVTGFQVFNARSESLQPVRIPINRRARRLRFRIAGTNQVNIQGIKLEVIA